MAPSGIKASVAYAMIGFAEGKLPANSWPEALRASLVAGTWVERYGRRWYMAQWQESGSGRWIIGKLAFEFVGEEPAVWDAEQNDVRTLDSLAIGTRVQVVPFVIDSTAQRAAFELRSQTVRPGTFQGNLQALLVKASNLPWRVTLEGVKQEPWDEWHKRVERVTAIWITVKPPNPHSPIPEIEELFKKGVKTGVISAHGDDIDVDGSTLLEGALGNALDYGSASADAVVADAAAVHKEHWRSEEEGGVRKDEAQRDESGHVPPAELQRLLEQRAAEQTYLPDAADSPDDGGGA